MNAVEILDYYLKIFPSPFPILKDGLHPALNLYKKHGPTPIYNRRLAKALRQPVGHPRRPGKIPRHPDDGY